MSGAEGFEAQLTPYDPQGLARVRAGLHRLPLLSDYRGGGGGHGSGAPPSASLGAHEVSVCITIVEGL